MSERRNQFQQDGIKEVSVYLRNSQKRALLVKLKMHIQYDQIHRIVSEKLRISDDKIIIFFKGERIGQSQRLVLSEKCIIHYVNMDKVKREYINIQIKRIEGQKITHKFKLRPNTSIKEFIDGEMYEVFHQNIQEIFLVYTGKQLDINKTFEEELVQDQSELLCVRLDQSQFQVSSSSLSNYSENKAILSSTIKNASIQHHSKQKTNPQIQLRPGRTYVQSFLKKPISPNQDESNNRNHAQSSQIKRLKQQKKEVVVLKSQNINQQQKNTSFKLDADTLRSAINIQSFNPMDNHNLNFNHFNQPSQSRDNLKTPYEHNTESHDQGNANISNGIANQFLNFYQNRQQNQTQPQIKGQLNHKDQSGHPYANQQPHDFVQNIQQTKDLSYEKERQEYLRDNKQQAEIGKQEEQNNANEQDYNEQDEQGDQRRVIHFFFQSKRQNPPTKIITLQDQIHSKQKQAIPNQKTHQQNNQYGYINMQQLRNQQYSNQVQNQYLDQENIDEHKIYVNGQEEKVDKLNSLPVYHQELVQNHCQNQLNERPQQQEQLQITNQQEIQKIKNINERENEQNIIVNKDKISNSIIPQVIHQMSNPHINTFKNAFDKLKNKNKAQHLQKNIISFSQKDKNSEQREEMINDVNANPMLKVQQDKSNHNLAVQQEQIPKFNSSDSLPSNDQLPRQKLLLKQVIHKQQINTHNNQQKATPSEQIKNTIQNNVQSIEPTQKPQILDLINYSLNTNNNQSNYHSQSKQLKLKQRLNIQHQDQDLLYQQQPLIQNTTNNQKIIDHQVHLVDQQYYDHKNDLNSKQGHITQDKVYQEAQFNQNHQNAMPNKEDDDNEQQFQMVQVANQQNIQFKAGDLIYSGEMNINNSENLMKNIIEEYSHLLKNNQQQGSINHQK